jgi:DNA-binding PadR family transcriptional regulator
MYRATARGKKLLERLREDVRELYEEVVLGQEPRAREDLEGVARIGRSSKKGRS